MYLLGNLQMKHTIKKMHVLSAAADDGCSNFCSFRPRWKKSFIVSPLFKFIDSRKTSEALAIDSYAGSSSFNELEVRTPGLFKAGIEDRESTCTCIHKTVAQTHCLFILFFTKKIKHD